MDPMDLDFSGLTDDQLIGLIRAACAEARRRGTATNEAARNVYLDEVERARIAQAAELLTAERLRNEEAQRVAKEAEERLRREADQKKIADVAAGEVALWAKRKGIAQALDAVGWDCKGDQLVVWLSPSKEKRVFLQQAVYGGATWATLYVTGNNRNAPGSATFSTSAFKGDTEFKRNVKAVLEAVAKNWNAIKVDLSAALAWKGDATPMPNYTAPSTPEPPVSPTPAPETAPEAT